MPENTPDPADPQVPDETSSPPEQASPDQASTTSTLTPAQATPSQVAVASGLAMKNRNPVAVWLLPHGYNMGAPIEQCRPDRVICSPGRTA